jgi:Heavy metal associated domain 2
MLLLAHEVAGRLRFVSPELKNDRQLTIPLLRLVRAVPGVTEVRVRNQTGSIIVLHDGAPATRNAVLQSLPVIVTSDETQNQKHRLLDELAEGAAQKLLSIVARRVIAALL